MNQTVAIAKARAFVLANTAVDADPEIVRLIECPASTRSWLVCNSAANFFPEVAAGRAIVDGGELNVEVDDETGRVTVFR